MAAFPKLKWTPPPAPPLEEDSREQEKGLSSRLKTFFSGKPNKLEQDISTKVKKPEEDRLQMPLQEQAEMYEKENDFLAAAVCYSMLKNTIDSARCYRRAVDLSENEQTLPPIPEVEQKSGF